MVEENRTLERYHLDGHYNLKGQWWIPSDPERKTTGNLELDGTYLRYHQGAERKEPILVATGYRADGTRVLLHIGVGNRESYENWKGFLQEMVARGMREPLLIVTDGNPGVLKAIAEVFPRSLKQRCQKHRLENILGKAPKEVRDELKAVIVNDFETPISCI